MPDIEYLSMAALESVEEELSAAFNAEADANASLPPFPKGLYVMKLVFQEDDPEKRWLLKKSKKDELFYYANVVGEIVDNPANPVEWVGRKVFANAMTLVQQQTGTTGAQAIIQAMGEGEKLLLMPKTHNTQVKLLNQLLAQGALIGANTDWEANLYDKAEDKTVYRLRGMNSFPKDAAGHPIPFGVAEDGTEVPARNIVKNWMTVDRLFEIQQAKAEEEEGEGREQAEEAAPAVVAAKSATAAPAPRVAAPAPSQGVKGAAPAPRRPVPTR